MLNAANQILTFLTILAQVIFAAGLVYWLFFRPRPDSAIGQWLSRQGIVLAFWISLAAVLGSLFYSEIAGFKPCELCWYQRIFMYPQVILLGIAWLKKEAAIIRYSLTLAALGATFSLYHNYISLGGQPLTACATFTTVGVSCLQRYVFEFGYITIPLMALTAFALIILILGAQKILIKKN